MSASYDQWLEFVFANPVRGREWYWDEDFDFRWAALELNDSLIVRYLTRLFLHPEALSSYSLDQVEQGLWFLIGESSPGSSSQALLRRETVLSERVACIHAISNFFRSFVLAVTDRDYDPNENRTENAVKCVCYMWWDIFPLHHYTHRHAPVDPALPAKLKTLLNARRAEVRKVEIEAEIYEATLKVMTEVLDLPSELCQFSALHGLGHWHDRFPERIEQIVEAFVARNKNLGPHVIEYASNARLGRVL
ncbi:MAG TPA: hypothetical protein VGG45_13555 [Terracidiphilus sp.]|jgi:hypothetical protein